jgi:site-specific DNA recombinase
VFESLEQKDNRLRAIIYDRISEDADGERENVEIRLAESRDYCADEGWVVVAEYSDNDISASGYSKKKRDGYDDMFNAVAAGACEIVVTTEMERLYRRLEELLELIKLAERTPLRRIQCTDGSGYNLSTGPGIHGAIGAVNNAMLESRKISDRMKRKKAARASTGAWWGGHRPFGYQLDEQEGVTGTGRKYIYYKLEIDPREAELAREAAKRVRLAGWTPTGVARDWGKRGIRGVRGALIDTTEVRRMLTSPHLAGLRTHHGKLVEGSWEPILSRQEWEEVCAMLKRTPLPHEVKQPRSYELTGFLACSCDALLHAHGRRGQREYECRAIDGGCGHTRRKAEPIEKAVRDMVLTALADPDFRGALEAELRARQGADSTVRELRARREQDQARLSHLRDRLADGKIDDDDFAHAKARITERLDGIERALAARSSPDAALLAQLPEEYDALQASWAGWKLDERRAVIRLALNRLTVLPTRPGRRVFDPRAELKPDWRV